MISKMNEETLETANFLPSYKIHMGVVTEESCDKYIFSLSVLVNELVISLVCRS